MDALRATRVPKVGSACSGGDKASSTAVMEISLFSSRVLIDQTELGRMSDPDRLVFLLIY
jgi:hypothetical protein